MTPPLPPNPSNADLARAWKLTRERVRQIERSALKKLRDGLLKDPPPEFREWLSEHTRFRP